MSDFHLPDGGDIYMIGIGGSGMSGLAIIMSEMGYHVSGSDLGLGPNIELLREHGITIHRGHDAANLGNADLVVLSAAIPDDNPEKVEALSRGITCISRGEMLGKLMSMRKSIAVAGTHGKTSTTSMLATVLEYAHMDPTIYIGGNLDLIGGNAKLGYGEYFVAEACEAFNSFQSIYPDIAVITNIEADHMEFYGSLNAVINSFRRFAMQTKDNGFLVVCNDSVNIQEILPDIMEGHRVITYGITEESHCRAVEVDVSNSNPAFDVIYEGANLGRFRLSVPGKHNVYNSLAAIAVGLELGIDVETMKTALREFHGAGRRFEELGTANGITVIDDYAHHPTEVRATLMAARSLGRRVVALFQPHLYSRTIRFATEFAESLSLADIVFLTDIYPSREKPVPGVTSQIIADKLAECQKSVIYVPGKDVVVDYMISYLKNDDVVLVMGAGDIRKAGEKLLHKLQMLDMRGAQ